MKKSICLAAFFFSLNFCLAQSRLADAAIMQLYSAKQTSAEIKRDSAIYYLVTFKKNPLHWPTGLHLVKRISLNAYIVSASKKITPDDNLLTYSAANYLWKATDDLAKQGNAHPTQTRLVTLALKQPAESALNRIRKFASVTSVNGNNITVNIQLKQLPGLLADDNVLFANPVRKAHEELAIQNIDLGVNTISAITDNYPGINGNGINVSLKEDSYDDTDLDLLGRSFISAPKSANISSHANIMATLLGGNGNSYVKGLGAAPAVRFTSSNFSRLLPDSLAYFTNSRISIQNHSYGVGIENFYGIEAVAYDKQLFENDTLVHVFSSGNIGTSIPADGLYNGIANVANLSGTFKQAKNVLVAGGTGRTDVPEALSSAGPAYDGRVKPELVVDGEDGTSGAAALTSGSVALLQQAYKKQYGKLPPAALIKSVLINAADDIGLPAVDFKTGYGKLNALQALRTITDGRFKTGTLNNRQQQSFQITIPQNCGRLKVSIAWNDPPAQLNAPFALVNNLDLSVKTPAGETLLPWTLSTYPALDSLIKPAVRKKDTLNNTEQVTLQNPPPGVYTIQVDAARITNASQPFYVTYETNLANGFEWTYPSGNNQLFAGEDNYLRWQNSYTSKSGQLSVSFDHGATFQPIITTALTGGFYQWAAPDKFTQAILKMTINGQDHLSKEFTLSKPLTLNVGFNCSDGTLLHWNAQPGALRYTIYTIKDDLLQKLTSTTDTSIIIPPQMQSSKYFAVSAQTDAFEGIKSFTIDATAQGVGCYVQTLLADVTTDNKIALTLALGSTLNLKDITWQKLTGIDLYQPIGVTAVGGSLAYQFIDQNPKKGINYYRAALSTTDGRIIYSGIANAILLQPNQFTLYPNPVTTQLNILAGELNTYELKLYDTSGLLRMSKTFDGLQNIIPINLMPGVYISTISLNGTILYKGKMLKL